MSLFDLHTAETAPEGSKGELTATEERFGFLPNIYGVMAESPAVIKAYNALSGLMGETAFSPAEQQLLLLTISAVNGCEYCVAAHTLGARKAQLDESVIEATRDGGTIKDSKLAALQKFTRLVVEKRGFVSESEIEAFIEAGYSRQHSMEVVMAAALKTISNYINHFAETPLDSVFTSAKWQA